jgi:hypothetical protein
MANRMDAWWQTVGEVAPTELVDARLQLHWAAQVVPAVADRVLEREGDDSHSNMGWDLEARALIGRPLPDGLRVALWPAELRLGIGSERIALAGRTLEDVFAWVEGRLETEPLARRGYEMPEHAVSAGRAFDADPRALAELNRWLANGFAVLEWYRRRLRHPSEVACWPHHFDVGAIERFEERADNETAPQIGLGLSPGDQFYAEPYFYVTPYPVPAAASFAALPAGHWRTAGFTGAILPASEIVDAADQPGIVLEYLEVALAVGRQLIGKRGGT